uniref:Uncharacterized protein n=1 Tax=Chelonoidis abingdonii TaxID=106734 RepID=A0A8C0G2P6_CHEAB
VLCSEICGERDLLANVAAQGDVQRLRLLLEAGMNPNTVNSFGRTPIQKKNHKTPSLFCYP